MDQVNLVWQIDLELKIEKKLMDPFRLEMMLVYLVRQFTFDPS